MKRLFPLLLLLITAWSNAWGYANGYTFTGFPAVVDLSESSVNDQKLTWSTSQYGGSYSYRNIEREASSFSSTNQRANGCWLVASSSSYSLYFGTSSGSPSETLAFASFGGISCAHYAAANTAIELPKMTFIAGKKYVITYSVKSLKGSTETIKMGIASQKYTSGSAFSESEADYVSDAAISNTTYATKTMTITAPATLTDGGYLVIRCASAEQGVLCLNSIKVEQEADPAVTPDYVTAFTAAQSETKPLTAELAWTCPTTGKFVADGLSTSLEGRKLKAKISRTVRFGTPTVIATINDLTPGESYTYNNVAEEEGFYTYNISMGCDDTFDDGKVSAVCDLVNFFPRKITDLSGTADGLKVTLKWTNPAYYTNEKTIIDAISTEVYRNAKLVATLTNQAIGGAITYEDDVPEAGSYAYYIVTKAANGAASDNSNGITLQDVSGAIDLPYDAQAVQFLNWTKTDINNDGYCWNLGATKDNYSLLTTYDGDDQLTSPLLKAATAGDYKVAFTSSVINVPTQYIIKCLNADGSLHSTALTSAADYTATARNTVYADIHFDAPQQFAVAIEVKTTEPGTSFIVNNVVVTKAITPEITTNLTVTPDANRANKAVLSWKNAAKGSASEPFTHNLSARIYRNGELVATVDDLAASAWSSYTDNVPAPGYYTYAVCNGYEGNYGEKATAAETGVGKIVTPVVLPYAINFITDTPSNTANGVHTFNNGTWAVNSNSWTTLKTGGYWAFDNYYHKYGVEVYHSYMAANAWMYSPAMPVEAGKSYAISFTASRKTDASSKLDTENYDITIGNAATVDAQTTILGSVALTSDDYVTVIKKFTATETGDIYVGAHYNTPEFLATATGISFSGFSFEETTIALPAEIADLTATADAEKEFTIDLAWTNPTKDKTDGDLSDDLDVQIYRGTTLVKTLTATAGSKSAWSETLTAAGTYAYTVKVGQYGNYNTGATASATVEAFTPNTVTDFTANPASSLDVLLAFTAPATFTNGATITGNVSIEIYRNNMMIDTKTVAPGAEATYTDELIKSGSYTYYVIARTANGNASAKSASITLDTTTVGVNNVNGSSTSATGSVNAINVVAAQGSEVMIYALNGKLIAALAGQQEMTIPMEAGIYLVKIGGYTAKVLVK